MSKARKGTIITVAVVLALSVIVIVASNIIKARILKDPGRIIDLGSDVTLEEGERVTFQIGSSSLKQASDELYYIRTSYSDDDAYTVYPVSGYRKGLVTSSNSSVTDGTRITAIVVNTAPEDKQAISDAQIKQDTTSLNFFHDFYDSGEYTDYGYTEEKILTGMDVMTYRLSDEGIEEFKGNISPLTFKTVDISIYGSAALIASIVSVLSAVVLLYAVLGIKFKAHQLVIGTVLLILILIALAAFILRKDISTMMSLKQYCPGLYMARIDNDYKLEDMLEHQPSSESEMLGAISNELFYNIPISVDLSSFGCSAFSCRTSDGTHLLGRNFDLGDTDGTIIYTAPENGYRSIGVCDLSVINLAGKNSMAEVTSLTGRALCRAFPYMTFDGMNEAGLGIAILSLDFKPTHPDTSKPDTYMLLAIRAILDTCSNVDEAVELLDSYDVHSMAVYNYHLFLTDKSGRSVVAEWVDNELYVIETDHVCNSYLVESVNDPTDDRYRTLDARLAETGGVLSVEEAMDLLSQVEQDCEETQTEWSCVYDLDNFKVYIVSDMHWGEVYEITPESFK